MSDNTITGGFSGEIATKIGAEARLGVRFTPNRIKNFYISYGVEVFGEFSKIDGLFWEDYGAVSNIGHNKKFIGAASSIYLSLKLTDRLCLFSETRLLFGEVSLNEERAVIKTSTVLPNRNYWEFLFEPLSALGIKIHLGDCN